jgi:hypothetical protein
MFKNINRAAHIELCELDLDFYQFAGDALVTEVPQQVLDLVNTLNHHEVVKLCQAKYHIVWTMAIFGRIAGTTCFSGEK